jgi:hypothetical protein
MWAAVRATIATATRVTASEITMAAACMRAPVVAFDVAVASGAACHRRRQGDSVLVLGG